MTRRRYKQHTEKLTALALIPLIALAILGITHSHWQETLTITGTIKTGYAELIIDSHKLLIPKAQGFNETYPIYYYVTSDNLWLVGHCQNVTDNWIIKIGLIIKNNGTFPLNLRETLITFNITDTSQFNVTTYYYGPFPLGTNFNFPYWDGISFDEVPPSGNVTPPVSLDPSDHAISWTIIQYIGDPDAQGINIQVTTTLMDADQT
jgi:hypothetical protein